MPLVFVHGVSNRNCPEYRENQFSRDAFLRAIVFPRLGLDAEKAMIFNPYWGDDGVRFRWGNASLPESDHPIETFGAGPDEAGIQIAAEALAGLPARQGDIVQVARRSLLDAVDLLWAAALPAASDQAQADALARSYRDAVRYAHANARPAWLAQATGANFVDQLLHEVGDSPPSAPGEHVEPEEKWETFGAGQGGVMDSLKEALSRLTTIGDAALGSVVTSIGRKRAHLAASLFVGDVFQYLAHRGDRNAPGPIVQRVLDAFRRAQAAASENDPRLYILGHSLGGVISYDILTHFAPDLPVDSFITVGSQVGLFAEMSLYLSSQPDVPPNPPADRLPRPGNVRRWLNVLDRDDIFGFSVEGVFSGAEDFAYDTGYGLMQAHSGYFHRPSFYRRLGERLATVP